MGKYNTEKTTNINGKVSYRPIDVATELPESTLPTTVTDGYTHHFSVGDEIKWCRRDSFFVQYGDVIRINKRSITIKCNGSTSTVDPRELNFD